MPSLVFSHSAYALKVLLKLFQNICVSSLYIYGDVWPFTRGGALAFNVRQNKSLGSWKSISLLVRIESF